MEPPVAPADLASTATPLQADVAPDNQDITEDDEGLELENPDEEHEIKTSGAASMQYPDEAGAGLMAACLAALAARVDVDKEDPLHNPLTAMSLICSAYLAHL